MSGTGAASAEPLEALEVIAALRRFGWEQETRSPGRYEAWVVSGDRPDTSIFVPLDATKGDYEHLLARARRALVGAIGAEAEQFLRTLHQRMSGALDLTRFGKETAASAGAISWRQGMALIQSVERTLAAAAKAAGQPRRYHGASNANIARELLDATLMGQTEVGSFVVRALTPASQRFFLSKASTQRSGQLPDLAGRTGRQIIATLERSVRTTRGVLDEFARQNRVELFADAVEDGVSFELVRALAEFARDSQQARVLIDYAGRPDQDQPQVEISFSATDAPVLDSAAIHLGADRPSEEVRLRGTVEMLRGRGVGDAGVVGLQVVGGARANKVRVRLSSEDYERAWSAHGQNAVMVVTGRLEKEGQYFWMYEPSEIEFQQPTDPDDSEQLTLGIEGAEGELSDGSTVGTGPSPGMAAAAEDTADDERPREIGPGDD